MCPHASGVMPLGARGFCMNFNAPLLQCRILLCQQRCDFLSVWGIVAPVRGQLCETFGSVLDQFSINLGYNRDQFESGPKDVPACVQGYAVRRPGI